MVAQSAPKVMHEPTTEGIAEDERLLREVCGAQVKRKDPVRVAELAGRRGKDPKKTYDAAIRGTDGNVFSAKDLLAAARADDTRTVKRAICDAIGVEPKFPEELTWQEKFERVFAFLSRDRILSLEYLDRLRAYSEGQL